MRLTAVPTEAIVRQHVQQIIDTYGWAKERTIVELVRVHSPAELKEKTDAVKKIQEEKKITPLQEKQEAWAGVHADEEAEGE